MRLNEEQTQKIKEAFDAMKTKVDLLVLLNYIKSIIYGEKAIPFETRQINYYCNANKAEKRYRVFKVKKKSGGTRNIHAPQEGLMRIQECLKVAFECMIEVDPHAFGFVSGRSIIDNARVHVGRKFVFNTDLKDFFPSIDQPRIWKRLQVPPFKLNEQSGRRILADIIAGLCCAEMRVSRSNEDGVLVKSRKFVLPQGAPTSPILSNIICVKLDYKLSFMAKRFGMKYSRYADDITFSGDKNIYFNSRGSFMKELKHNIVSEGFLINNDKTRVQPSEFRQEVTGLVVNQGVNIPKRYMKQLRMWLYYWESYGYDRMVYYFMPKYFEDKKHLIKDSTLPDFKRVIRGKLNYIRMVKGKDDPAFIKLWERFLTLTKSNELITSVLSIWEKEGLDRAMDRFYK